MSRRAAAEPVAVSGRVGTRLLREALIGLVKAYQVLLSPWLGGRCRYQPTCSAYAEEALRRHGAARGLWLTLRRLGRCHPWGRWGYDPVPERHDAEPPRAP